jgi:predicted permease
LFLRLLPSHLRDEHEAELIEALTADTASPRRVAFDVTRAAFSSHVDVLGQDLRVAFRQLARAPAFAIVAILTLGAGIGGNTVFFSLADGVLFRQLPIPDADRIVTITEENLGRGMRDFGIAPGNFRDAVRDSTLFAAAALLGSQSAGIRIGDDREQMRIASVGGDFFRVLAERPVAGRTLQPEDDVPDARTVVLSRALAQRMFGDAESALGRDIEIDEKPFHIVGVMPQTFVFPSSSTVLWKPLGLQVADWDGRGARYLEAVAKLRRGISIADAAAAVAAIGRALTTSFPATNRGWSLLLRDARSARVSSARGPLLLAWGAGALVLLIAISNVASLMLTRAVAREREMALRVALGARVGRVLRQLMTECGVLSGLGCLVGLSIARLSLLLVRPLAVRFVPRMDEVAVDRRAVVYATALAIATMSLLTVISLSSVRRDRLWGMLGSARGGASRHRRRVQRGIVVAEAALAVFVLVAGGLVVHSLARLLSKPMGFEPHDLLTFRVEPPWRMQLDGLRAEAQIAAINAERRRANGEFSELVDRLRALPGVRGAAGINRLPLTGDWWTSSITLPQRPALTAADRIATFIRPVTPAYFEVMGQRVLRGRSFTSADGAGAARVAVIDAGLARQLWGDANPIGREIVLDGPNAPRALVVGVVEAVHLDRLDATPRPAVYVPFAQAIEGFYLNWGMDLIVRGAASSSQLRIHRLVHEVFPEAVVFRMASMDDVIAQSTADRRFQLVVVGAFGVIALVLSSIGIGGTMLLAVRERREELAVRLALGAAPGHLWWRVQTDGMLLAGAGVTVGIACAFAAARVFSSVVYEIDVRDPMTMLGAAVLTLLSAFLATAIPAAGAVRVSPALAMRTD